jgi:hypothetical protein
MPLDLWQRDADTAISDTNNPSRARLPATFDDTFSAAWRSAEFFTQSTASHNARQSVLTDAIGDIRRRTGIDLSEEATIGTPETGMQANADLLNAAIVRHKAKDPSFAIDPIPGDEVDRRTVEKSRTAVSEYAALQQREQTAGGRFGSFLGGFAGAAADPVNVLALPVVAPEGLGVLATAGIWSLIGAGTQAVGELAGAPYREQVQPGYIESGRPGANILEAGLFAGGTAGLIKGAAAAWTRVATGSWPRSVRDAGNVVASEANVERTNAYPGTAGEVAHREALTGAIDSILKGEPVKADGITPELERGLAGRLAPLMGMRQTAIEAQAAAEAERAAVVGERAPELPFAATAATARADAATNALAGEVTDLAKVHGYDMPAEEAAAVARGLIKTPDAEVRQMLGELITRPSGAAETIPRPRGAPAEESSVPLRAVPPAESSAMLASPDHAAALRGDIDRARATGDVQIPTGLDEKGNVVFRSVDDAMKEVDSYATAADQIKGCVNPLVEEAA